MGAVILDERGVQQLELWGPHDVEHGWSIRQSARARRLSVRVFRHGGVEVVVPPRTSPHRISAFISQQREWIERQRRRAIAPLPWPLPPATLELSAFDEQWTCVQIPSFGRVRVIGGQAQELELHGDLSDLETLRTALIGWLVAHAKGRFAAPLAELARQVGVEPRLLQVRCQRTRWGSCSRRGTVSLNACLLFQRPEVVRYLLIHELAHLKYMNHSRHFWAEVARHEAQWKALDRELLRGWKRVPAWIFARR
jgi:predicted metal-dependent hydrolase